MPRFTDNMPKDLLETLDPTILSVEYTKGIGCLKLKFAFGETIILMQQDLTTLSRFLRQQLEEDH